MAMAASISSSIRDGGSFPGGKRPFMGHRAFSSNRGLRVHAVFARIGSCLRNLFVISSLSFSFTFTQKYPAPKFTGLSRGDSTFGSRDLAPNRLSSSQVFDASAAFPMAVLHLSSPNRRARNWYLDRSPLSSPRAAGLCLSRARPRRSQGGAPRGSRKRGPRQASTKAQERSVTKSSRC